MSNTPKKSDRSELDVVNIGLDVKNRICLETGHCVVCVLHLGGSCQAQQLTVRRHCSR